MYLLAQIWILEQNLLNNELSRIFTLGGEEECKQVNDAVG